MVVSFCIIFLLDLLTEVKGIWKKNCYYRMKRVCFSKEATHLGIGSVFVFKHRSNHHSLGGLQNGTLFPCNSRGLSLEIKVSAGLVASLGGL